MVQFDSVLEPTIMETCVLIPEDFSLKIDAAPQIGGPLSPYTFLGNLFPSMLPPFGTDPSNPENGRYPTPPLGESRVRVCASKKLPVQARYLPFSGTVRTDKLPFMNCLSTLDIRHRLGSYDEVVDRSGKRIRLCNWVRFVRYEDTLNPRVNMVATRNRGSVVFDVIKEIPAGEELVVFLLPESTSEDPFSLSALAILRSSFYRRTLDSIMSESPLDLSRSLISADEDEVKDRPEGKKVVPDTDSEGISSNAFKRNMEPCSNPFLSPFTSSPSVFPTYFPFGFPPHHLFPHSPFALSRFSPIISDSLLSIPKAPSSSSSITAPKVSIPSSSSPSKDPLRLQPPPPKRRERTMLPCSECGKTFDRPSLLKRHMRTHTGEKPHVCDVCGKGFSTSSSLNTHRRIHSGEKPHQCGVCGKRFTASSNLYYHKMTHIKEKPHKCTLCTRSFPTPGDLRSHMFVHNGQWPHKCGVCGKGFSKLTNLRNHTLLHTGDRQTKRPFVLDMERTPESSQDTPPSSSSIFPSFQSSSLSPSPVSSPPIQLLSSSSSSPSSSSHISHFALSLSVLGSHRKVDKDEEVDEENEEDEEIYMDEEEEEEELSPKEDLDEETSLATNETSVKGETCNDVTDVSKKGPTPSCETSSAESVDHVSSDVTESRSARALDVVRSTSEPEEKSTEKKNTNSDIKL